MTTADLYLRLSDFRGDEDGFEARERKLRAEAGRIGWTVGRVVIENDLTKAANGRSRPATAFKRKPVRDKDGKLVRDPDTGKPVMRVIRPGWQSVIADLKTGRAGAVLAEDLDRVARDPRDLEDLIDAVETRGASARSLSGSLKLTNGGEGGEIDMARVMVMVGNKASRDTARRVAAQRERTAEAGFYGGGRRPFGYEPDPDAPKYAKNLLVVPAEAQEVKDAARAVLTGGSLKALARDLRERKVPTVTGATWTPETVSDCLMKPTVAGLAAHTKTIRSNGDVTTVTTWYEAKWPAILDRETWEAVRAILTNPARRTTPGNEPKWLGTNLYVCSKCKTPTMRVTGGSYHKHPGYICREGNHMRRVAPQTDQYVGAVIAARLAREDARDLLLPPARPGIDAAALRQEAAKLRVIGESQARLHAVGDMSDAEFAAGSRTRKDRLARITAQLAANTTPDPLAEFRDRDDAAEVWAGLPLQRKRAVLRTLAVVTILPARGGPGFHPETVQVRWHDPNVCP
jgi:DNA invertase Pin-like site-specific DNA recombinase